MKFGGASLSTAAQFDAISNLIVKKRESYSNVVIVVSAMGETTNELTALAKSVNPTPPQRELDMLLSVGERISMSLLAMALAKRAEQAISFTGSQSGIITSTEHSEAKIIAVKPHRILSSLEEGKIVIVAGFQGVSRTGEITTLGRGGSDTTAVALAIALRAEKVEFYKDVPGFFEEDPKTNPEASHFAQLSYDQAIEIVANGAKILHQRSLHLARSNQIPLHVLSFKEDHQLLTGTVIRSDAILVSLPIYECEVS
ncbi:MAG: aspartate kinase [Verrucomicrobia bacterium]|nr:aspartate kinase [Verrucomicrobiota bacterium]